MLRNRPIYQLIDRSKIQAIGRGLEQIHEILRIMVNMYFNGRSFVYCKKQEEKVNKTY